VQSNIHEGRAMSVGGAEFILKGLASTPWIRRGRNPTSLEAEVPQKRFEPFGFHHAELDKLAILLGVPNHRSGRRVKHFGIVDCADGGTSCEVVREVDMGFLFEDGSCLP